MRAEAGSNLCVHLSSLSCISQVRLLYICEADTGGIAEYAIWQSQALARAGVEVVFLCRSTFPTDRLAGLDVRTDLPRQPVWSQLRAARMLAKLTDAQAVARTAARAARNGGFGRVLFACYHEYFAPLWTPVLRDLARDGVVIATIAHDPVRDFVAGPLWWHRWSVRQGYSFVRHVFVHDDTPVDFGGPRPDAIMTHVIPHGPLKVAPPRMGREAVRSRLGFKKADSVFLSFGQIRDGKNLDLFLRAMVDAPTRVKLLVAGSGGAASQRAPEFYQLLADELGVKERCRWDLRHIPDEEVGDLFAAADVALLSYSAKFRSASGVLNTAIACRKPVLASSGAGPLRGSVEAYELGAFIPPDDAVALSDGIVRVLTAVASPQWDRYLKENSWERNARGVLGAFYPDGY